MGRRKIPFTQDSVVRAIRAVKQAGIEIRTVRIEPDGTVIINGDSARNGDIFTEEEVQAQSKYYL